MGRYDTLRLIESLDPETEYWRIHRLHALHEFPWDVTRALELALYRTYAVPSIGELLDSTAEFRTRTQKRYDDTALLLGEVLEHGFDSEHGRAAVRRINQVHGRFAISADDYRYVLATLLVVPARWVDRYGWRPVSDHERRAAYLYHRELGRRMGITEWPTSYDEVVAFLDAYEAERVARTPGGTRTAVATRDLFVSWFPRVLAPLTRRAVLALLDPPLLDAFGFARPAPPVVAGADLALRARGRLVRVLPPRRGMKPARRRWTVKGYRDGYRIEELGADPPGRTPPAGHQRPWTYSRMRSS
jgi:ER-bound oxygenase mpaB/B'/Rubber oxygenase, catalytic domain